MTASEPFKLNDWQFDLYFCAENPSLDIEAFKSRASVKATLAHLESHQADIQQLLEDAIKDQAKAEAYESVDPVKEVTPTMINIFETSKDGLHLIGFEFGCPWEDEHGLGAIVHGSQLLKHGDGDLAIYEWMAEECLEQLDNSR